MDVLAKRLAAFVVGTPVVGVAALLALGPGRVDLVVVNGAASPVVVTVAGRGPQRVEAEATLRLEGLTGGRARLAATTVDGAPLDDLEADLRAPLGAPRRTWVWDVAAASSSAFARVTRGYGDRERERRVEAFTPPGRVFALPPDLLPEVDGPFPDRVQAPAGSTGAARTALWTGAHLARVAPATVELSVDASLGKQLRLEVDGVEQALIPGGACRIIGGIPAGRHRLRVVEVGVDGREGAYSRELEADLTAEHFAPPAGWVWDVDLGTPEYLALGRTYGGAPGQAPPPMERFVPPGELFRLPPGYLPGLDLEHPDAWREAGVLRALWTPRRLGQRGAASRLDASEAGARARALLRAGLGDGPQGLPLPLPGGGAPVAPDEPPFPPPPPPAPRPGE